MARLSHLILAATTVALLASACAPAATPTPASTLAPTVAPATATPTMAETATPTTAASATPTMAESASPSASTAVVASIPPNLLEFAGKLEICSDLPYAPQEYFDANGAPIGSDIEIGQEIARRLGLTAEIDNSVFDTIILALTGGKCDIIISAQNITPERLGQVDMLPYFQAGQAFMVQAGNPANIQTAADLCGKKVAVEAGTTMLDYLQNTGTYKGGGGLPDVCKTAGKPDVQPQPFQKDSDAVAALQAGTADAYMSDLPTVIGYADAQPDKFMLAPVPQIAPSLEGISVAKSTDASKPHSPIYDAVKAALTSMINDGTYLNILKKYKVDGGAITLDQVNGPLPSPVTPSPAPT